MQIRVSLLEDHRELRDSIAELIKSSEELLLTGVYSNASDVLNKIRTAQPDVVLMDIHMPGISGIEALKTIKSYNQDIKVIMQTIFEDEIKISEAICAGASGYLLKKSPPQRYIDAIIDAYHGGAPIEGSIATKVLNLFRERSGTDKADSFHLSDREREIIYYLVKGLSYKMISDQCHISYDTVRFHIKNIYKKLNVKSMTELVAMALHKKIV